MTKLPFEHAWSMNLTSKETAGMNVWWCNQSGQWDVEPPEGVVCSQARSRRGGDN
jgi:hypothetical protein